ncbi:RHS repeat-associated core domain-containing protein [Streptomyces sp. McG3]|uniref:RHS repeat-associated core domain-containing protein n=1 Tax=Streptomyces sp. McG3 TaxID=2725483 RepID=UPI0035A8A783
MPRPDPGRGTALRLGSVVALTDEASTKVNTYAYSPRGVQRDTTTETVPQPYRFAGGYQDPTGLYRFAARFYDPNIGRFTTPGPSGQEQNSYLYATGDPVNNIDPSGLGWLQKAGDFLSDHENKVGAAVGCITGIGAAAETGVIQAASILGGPLGTVGAVAASCAVGGTMGYAGMDIISYG